MYVLRNDYLSHVKIETIFKWPHLHPLSLNVVLILFVVMVAIGGSGFPLKHLAVCRDEFKTFANI